MKRYMKLGAMSLGLMSSVASAADACDSFQITLLNDTPYTYTQVDTQATGGGRVVPQGLGLTLPAFGAQTLLLRPNLSAPDTMRATLAFLSVQPSMPPVHGTVVPHLFTVDVTIDARYWTHCDRRAVMVQASDDPRLHPLNDTAHGIDYVIGAPR